jgi:hypothetical protein
MGNTAYAHKVYATLLTVRLYFGLHAKCCLVACKHLKIVQSHPCWLLHDTNRACFMVHAYSTNTFFMKLPKLPQALNASTVFGIGKDPR